MGSRGASNRGRMVLTVQVGVQFSGSKHTESGGIGRSDGKGSPSRMVEATGSIEAEASSHGSVTSVVVHGFA